MMSDRGQLKCDCADALEALLRENRVDGLHNTGESIRMVSPAYKLHGEQIQAATWFREDNTITWHLIHVLEKLEQASPSLKSKRPAGPGRVIRLDERRSRTPRKERARLAEYLK